ncbi:MULTISPECIES: hypothetical protein [Luteimonas]|uniref:hypothetical protein n=1 Tax=Luteimonas TaxID=83614 RepID=UPI00117D3380|nr:MULTISPECIES: hypothetical protein [Luteimonas]
MRIWLAVLLLCGPPAFAQQIYKCSQATGGHAYQSRPCEAGDALQVWDGEALAGPSANPVPTAAAEPPGGTRATRPRAHRQGAHAASTVRQRARTRAPDRHARCEAARDRREAELRRLGLKRTYDQLRALNDRVSAACNHR